MINNITIKDFRRQNTIPVKTVHTEVWIILNNGDIIWAKITKTKQRKIS